MSIPHDAKETITVSLGEITTSFVPSMSAEEIQEDFLNEGSILHTDERGDQIIFGDSHYVAVLRTPTGSFNGIGFVRDEAIRNAMRAAVDFEVSVLREPSEAEIDQFQRENPFGA